MYRWRQGPRLAWKQSNGRGVSEERWLGPAAGEGGVVTEVEDRESDCPEFMSSLCDLLLAS